MPTYKCEACGQETGNAPIFLRDENRWEPSFCDACEEDAERKLSGETERLRDRGLD